MIRKTAITLAICAVLAVGSTAWGAVPDRTPAPLQLVAGTTLTGATTELEAALNEPSSITYKIIVVDENPADRTAYLDELLAEWGWPAPSEMLLVVFPSANYDLRFALGADFKLNYISVDDLLGLVRSEYFPLKNRGDAAGGLANLVRAVNRRMSPGGVTDQQARFEVMRQVVRMLEQQDAKGLTAMLDPDGFYVAPYAVGAPDNGLGQMESSKVIGALTLNPKPEILGYDLASPGQIRVVVRGMKAGLVIPASGIPGNVTEMTETVMLTIIDRGDGWRLSRVTLDPGNLLPERIEQGEFTKPFGWLSINLTAESTSWGFGGEPGGDANTTRQLITESLAEAREFLGQGVALPAWLDGHHMIIHRSYSREYRPLTTSLMSLDPSFHASYSPVGRHQGDININEEWTVKTEALTVGGRPALLVSLDQKMEGGWRHRYLLIEDGHWLYHLEDSQGDAAKLIAMAQEI